MVDSKTLISPDSVEKKILLHTRILVSVRRAEFQKFATKMTSQVNVPQTKELVTAYFIYVAKLKATVFMKHMRVSKNWQAKSFC